MIRICAAALLIIPQSLFAADLQPIGPMTKQAKEWGITKCIKEIESIDRFLNGKGGSHGAWSFTPKKSANTRLFSAINIKKYNDGTWGYAIVSVAPGIDQSCDGSLSTTTTYPGKSCASIRETEYKNYKYESEIVGKALYKDVSSLMFEDLNGSCVVIKHEPIYPVPK